MGNGLRFGSTSAWVRAQEFWKGNFMDRVTRASPRFTDLLSCYQSVWPHDRHMPHDLVASVPGEEEECI